jgi:hypothetical protein
MQSAEQASAASSPVNLPILVVANLIAHESVVSLAAGARDHGGIHDGSIHEPHWTELDNFANLPPGRALALGHRIELPEAINPPSIAFRARSNQAATDTFEMFSPGDRAVVQESKEPARRTEPKSELAPLNTDVFPSAGDFETVEMQAFIATNDTPSRASVSMKSRSIDAPKTVLANVADKTQPITEAGLVSADAITSVKPADSPIMVDAVPIAFDGGLVAPRAKQNQGEAPIDGKQRGETESVSVNHKVAIIETNGSDFNTHTESHSELPQRDARWLAKDGDFELTKDRVESAETALRHVVPDRPLTMTAPLPQRENISAAAHATAWRPVIDRVADEIIGHVQIGKHEAVLQLDPPELGKIKIDLWIDGAEIHARIVADEQNTKTLIESHLPELRQALDAGRVELVNLRVDHQEPARGNEQWPQGFADNARQGPRHGQSHGGLAERAPNDGAPSENPTRVASDTGRISMWA